MTFLKKEQNKNIKKILYGVVFFIFIWSVGIICSLSWNIYQSYQQSYDRAEAMALSTFNRDQAFRQWIAEHKGIYIRSTNPTNNSDSYTLLDPATFLKKVMTHYPDYFDSSVRMVGVRPLNQMNRPNPLEKKMLDNFAKGLTEYLDYNLIDESYLLGYFKPMKAKPACLSCHIAANFQIGDLIGAAGVYIDLKPFLHSAKELTTRLVISHLIIWIIGYIAIVLYGRKTELYVREELRLKEKIEQSNKQLEKRVIQRTNEILKLSQALENIPIMIAITDSNGFIEYVNPHFCQVSGYSSKDITGKNLSIIRSLDTSNTLCHDLWNTINKGHIWSGELCNLRKDGSEFWVSASIGAFFSDDDKIVNYISIEEDITGKKQAEKNLILAKEKAENANTAKSEFLASMSHELRTPLNAIIGFSQLAKLDNNNAAQQKANAQEINKAGKHLLSLINDVLDLTSIEIGRVRLNIQSIKFANIINECYQLIQSLAAKKNIKLNFSNFQCVCWVKADYLRLKQIILNIISNAVKYTPESGSVEISCHIRNNNVVIQISDTGAGISEENLTHLFEPFNRLGMENSNIQGTGIGLVISKKLIDMMSGEIQVQSVIGKGSTFSIILPKSVKEDVYMIKEDTIKIKSDKKQTKNISVFYVEDNIANVTLMKNIIQLQDDWKFRYAETAEQGLEMIKQDHPDIVLMDINLPGMDGIEACRIIKNNAQLQHIPVIAVSADVIKSNIDNAMQAGFTDYISKPLDVEELLNSIRKLL